MRGGARWHRRSHNGREPSTFGQPHVAARRSSVMKLETPAALISAEPNGKSLSKKFTNSRSVTGRPLIGSPRIRSKNGGFIREEEKRITELRRFLKKYFDARLTVVIAAISKKEKIAAASARSADPPPFSSMNSIPAAARPRSDFHPRRVKSSKQPHA